MNEELNSKIKEIGSIFGIENIPDNIGDIVGNLLSEKSNDENIVTLENENCEQNMNINNNTENEENKKISNIDISNLIGNINIEKLFNKINNKDNSNKKIQLLYAIEPFINGKRKEKINNCVKFLTFAEIAKDLKLL